MADAALKDAFVSSDHLHLGADAGPGRILAQGAENHAPDQRDVAGGILMVGENVVFMEGNVDQSMLVILYRPIDRTIRRASAGAKTRDSAT